MEPRVTETDVAMLMFSEDAWVALGAVLGLKVQLPDDELSPAEAGLAPRFAS